MERIMTMFADLIKIHKTPAPKNDFEKGVLDGIISARHTTRNLIEKIQKEEMIKESCSDYDTVIGIKMAKIKLKCYKCGETKLVDETKIVDVIESVLTWTCDDCKKDRDIVEGC